MTTAKTTAPSVAGQYEAWPYPHVPLLASMPSTHPWQLSVDWLWDRCGSGTAPARPRIWVAGCGTFQPYVIGLANPRAEILATDVAQNSMAIARRRCRLRGMRQVDFKSANLNEPEHLPDGPFDLIECYGVLMNLPDPTAVLRRLGQRLSPGGVLRIMVYPWYSRARIFQVQRVAKLLGLHAGDRSHPGLLRKLMRHLPREHPLRYAFCTYHDSRNDAGVVDAFLHAGDRGFSGFQLGALIRRARLRPAYWFHRPWGQPDLMAEKLGLGDRGQDFVLNYLDLWQELRGNFVVCLRRADETAPPKAELRPHPMFAAGRQGLRHRLRLLPAQVLGARLPTRTGDRPIRLRPAEVRLLQKGNGAVGAADEPTRARLQEAGLLLGVGTAPATVPTKDGFAGEERFTAPRLEIDRRAANPLYGHLFQAWSLSARHPELHLPDLETQMGRWLPWADPLEDDTIRFGLTPYGSYQRFRINVSEYLDQHAQRETVQDYGDCALRYEDVAFEQVEDFLRLRRLPRHELSPAEKRELWVLLFSYRSLFTGFERS